MAKVYADLIKKGLKTIDDVPERLKAAVMELLNAQGNKLIEGSERNYGNYLRYFDYQRQKELF